MTLLVRAGLLVTGSGEEIENGWLLARDGVIEQVGSGPAPDADEVVDEANCVAMPGLVNAHDHMYQWATRAYVPDGTLFEWLQALYPVWAQIDADIVRVAARAAMARLLLSGCTLSTDHHYVFPPGRPGIFEALVETAREMGLRFHPRPHRGGGEPLPRCRARLHVPRGRGALLAVLGDARADGGIRRTCAAPRPAPAHAPGRDAGRGALLHRKVRAPAAGAYGRPRMDRRRRVVRARNPLQRRRGGSGRRVGLGRRALSFEQHAAWGGHVPRCGSGPSGSTREPGRRRGCQQRGFEPCVRGAPGIAAGTRA